MEIRCVKGTYRLKLVSCENSSGFKGLANVTPEGDREDGWLGKIQIWLERIKVALLRQSTS